MILWYIWFQRTIIIHTFASFIPGSPWSNLNYQVFFPISERKLLHVSPSKRSFYNWLWPHCVHYFQSWNLWAPIIPDSWLFASAIHNCRLTASTISEKLCDSPIGFYSFFHYTSYISPWSNSNYQVFFDHIWAHYSLNMSSFHFLYLCIMLRDYLQL